MAFSFAWIEALPPIFDTRAGSSCHSCAAPWIARVCSLCLWMLIIKEGLSPSSPQASSLPAYRNSFMGEGQEISKIRNMALWASEPRKLLVLMQSPDWFLCQWLLTDIQSPPKGELSRREVLWMPLLPQMSCGKLDGAMVTHLSKLELANKAVSRVKARCYRAVGWKGIQEITGIVSLTETKKTACDIFLLA